jgi:hypothetical protein
MTKRRDPMDRVIESALQPGCFIGCTRPFSIGRVRSGHASLQVQIESSVFVVKYAVQ